MNLVSSSLKLILILNSGNPVFINKFSEFINYDYVNRLIQMPFDNDIVPELICIYVCFSYYSFFDSIRNGILKNLVKKEFTYDSIMMKRHIILTIKILQKYVYIGLFINENDEFIHNIFKKFIVLMNSLRFEFFDDLILNLLTFIAKKEFKLFGNANLALIIIKEYFDKLLCFVKMNYDKINIFLKVMNAFSKFNICDDIWNYCFIKNNLFDFLQPLYQNSNESNISNLWSFSINMISSNEYIAESFIHLGIADYALANIHNGSFKAKCNSCNFITSFLDYAVLNDKIYNFVFENKILDTLISLLNLLDSSSAINVLISIHDLVCDLISFKDETLLTQLKESNLYNELDTYQEEANDNKIKNMIEEIIKMFNE